MEFRYSTHTEDSRSMWQSEPGRNEEGSIPSPLNSRQDETKISDRTYRLQFTDPEFDITQVEGVRLRFLLLANGLPVSSHLQSCIAVDYELDRLLQFFLNVFNYHAPHVLNSTPVTQDVDSESRISMIKIGFAGLGNLAGHSTFAGLRIIEHGELMDELCKYWFSTNRKLFREESVITLRNLSSQPDVAQALVKNFSRVIPDSLKTISMNPMDTVADVLVSFIANMVQLPLTRSLLEEEDLILKLLPFLREDFHDGRRHSVSYILKTYFAETDGEKFLYNNDAEILGYLLLPLAGGEEYTEEEYESMPIDLQYLPTTKTRDPHPGVRLNLVACILLLSNTSKAREVMRSKNVYLILRDLHKFEMAHPEGLSQTVELIEDWVSAVMLTDDEPSKVEEVDTNISESKT